jgi:hypothetical protein
MLPLPHRQVDDVQVAESAGFGRPDISFNVVDVRDAGNRLLGYQAFVIDRHELHY